MNIRRAVAITESQLDDYRVATIRDATQLLQWLARYHRHETRCVERIPDGPAVLVGNHNGGLSLVDGLFLVKWYQHTNFTQRVYALGHDLMFRGGFLTRRAGEIGILRATRENARTVLGAGHKLLIFPGSDREAMRPFRARDRVDLGGKRGWAEIAVDNNVPVIPITNAGGHEALIVLRQGRRIARALGMDRWARLQSFPILLAMPWGLLAGPTAALPYLPLPAKVTVEIGEPIDPAWWSESESPVDILYDRVQSTLQETLHRLYRERRFPILG